jgi:hypothetical protein
LVWLEERKKANEPAIQRNQIDPINQTNQINCVLLLSPCLAVSWLPPLGSTILVEIDTISDTARVSSQKFVVPNLGTG